MKCHQEQFPITYCVVPLTMCAVLQLPALRFGASLSLIVLRFCFCFYRRIGGCHLLPTTSKYSTAFRLLRELDIFTCIVSYFPCHFPTSHVMLFPHLPCHFPHCPSLPISSSLPFRFSLLSFIFSHLVSSTSPPRHFFLPNSFPPALTAFPLHPCNFPSP